MAVTTPVFASIVPVAVLPLIHVPPVEASLRIVVEVGQIFIMPDIATGSGLTVATVVAIQPAGVE